MRVRAALLALACAAWGGAVSEHTDATEHADRGESRQKRQTLINPGAGAPGCADWSLLNYLLYYYLIQAQTTEGAQIQHQQTDQMAAALLRLRRVRGTDPLPTLLSQPAGQAAILTLLQKVTNGDTAQLLLLLNDIRDQGRAPPAVAGPLGQPLGQQLGVLQDQRRGVFGAGTGQRLSAQGQQFAAAIAAQQLAGQFDPLTGAGQPGLTGRKASGLAGEFGLNGIGAEVSELQEGPQAQAQVSQAAGGLQELLSVTKPPPTSVPAPPPAPATPAPPPPPPTEAPPKTTKRPTTPRPTTAPPKRPAAPPAERPRPATVRSSVLAPSTSLHVTTSTLVTTILLRKTKTVPAVRGDTPTSVEHVHTVTHVLTATGLQTKTIIVTPTLVISGTTTRTVFNGVPAEAATGRRRRRRRTAQPVPLAPAASLQASASAHVRTGGAEGIGVRTPQLPLLASAEA